MDDAGLVRGLQACGDLRWRAPSLVVTGRRSSRRTVARSDPFDVRHRDVLDAVDLAEVVNADDVLVRDLPRQEQFLLEAPLDVLRGGRIPSHFRPDDLEGDRDLELLVTGLIDSAHAADAELTQDVIPGPELLSGVQRSARLLRTTAGRRREAGRIGGLALPPRWELPPNTVSA